MVNRTAHHKHARAVHKKPKPQRGLFDYLVYFFMVATPLFEFPQVAAIYRHRSAEDVSLTTWLFFCVDNCVWMIYGLRKKEWPVFFTSLLYEVMEVAIVIGIILYMK